MDKHAQYTTARIDHDTFPVIPTNDTFCEDSAAVLVLVQLNVATGSVVNNCGLLQNELKSYGASITVKKFHKSL